MVLSPLIDDIVSKQRSVLSDLFIREGARPPLVIWDPALENLSQPLLKRFFRIAQAKANPDGTLDAQSFDLGDFGDLSTWMMQTWFDEAERTPRCAHLGAAIAAYQDTSLHRRGHPDTAEIEPDTHVDTFLRATYRAIRTVRKPLLTEHQPPGNTFVSQWLRLSYPLTDGPSTHDRPTPICGSVSVAYADNDLTRGLETLFDPFIVLDADHRVMYANRPARVLFNNGRFCPWGRDIADFAGFEVTLTMEPQDMFACGRVQRFSTRYLSQGVLLDLRIRARGLQQNGRYYYVLEIRVET